MHTQDLLQRPVLDHAPFLPTPGGLVHLAPRLPPNPESRPKHKPASGTGWKLRLSPTLLILPATSASMAKEEMRSCTIEQGHARASCRGSTQPPMHSGRGSFLLEVLVHSPGRWVIRPVADAWATSLCTCHLLLSSLSPPSLSYHSPWSCCMFRRGSAFVAATVVCGACSPQEVVVAFQPFGSNVSSPSVGVAAWVSCVVPVLYTTSSVIKIIASASCLKVVPFSWSRFRLSPLLR
jgi:hypothetical protein